MKFSSKPLGKSLFVVSALILMSVIALTPGLHTRANPGQDAPVVGKPVMGAMGIQRSTAELMAAQQMADAHGPAPRHVKPTLRWTNPDRKQNPNSPAVASYGGDVQNVSTTHAATAPQTVGIDFDSGTNNDAPAFPPDTMGAVGPTQFIIATNGRFRAYDKNTGAAQLSNFDVSPEVFFNSVMGSAPFNSDPRIRYDRLSQRWIIIEITVDLPNRVLIAISSTSTITSSTVWTFFYINNTVLDNDSSDACLLDYPTLGIDANALYIGGNQFCGTSLLTADFDQTTATIVRKSSILGAGPIVSTTFTNLMSADTSFVGPWTPQGVDNYDPAATQGYFIGTDGASTGLLQIRRISNPGGTPTLSANLALTVPATAISSDAFTVPHQGNSAGAAGRLDALDDRLYAAHLRNGRLWTAHNINVTNAGIATSGVFNRAGSRWYEIKDLDTTPALVQSGTVFDNTSGVNSFWIPTIMVNGQGHAAMGFSRAGTNTYVDAAFTGRLSNDALGSMGAVSNYEEGAAAYNPPGDAGDPNYGRRWGDYSMVTLDPCDDMTMYSIQEYVGSQDTWHLRTAKLLAPPPPQILLPSPGSIHIGEPNITLTITGTLNGYFYDPGPGFGCRLSVSFSGGVTVNSVTYISPSQISVNISTVGTPVGVKNLTVTNPDGQSRTYNGALAVSQGTQDTIGVYRNNQFLLRNSNNTGPADIVAVFGVSTDLPVVGDWNGDGIDTIGLYRPGNSTFYLKDTNSTAAPVAYQFILGVSGDKPISGDWNGDGLDSGGVFRPSNGRIYLRNALTTGFANFAMVLGTAGDVGLAGDWNNDGVDSPGVYRPSSSHFYVTNQVCNCIVFPDADVVFGNVGDVPIKGDWIGFGADGIGVFRPTNGRVYLVNSISSVADATFIYGIANDKPVAGNWAQVGTVLAPTFDVKK